MMNSNDKNLEKQQKLDENIQTLKSKITELNKTLQEKEIEFEHMEKERKGLKKYRISWEKTYYSYGEEEIEACTEEEAIQIAKDNVYSYDGHFDLSGEEPLIESEGEVEDY